MDIIKLEKEKLLIQIAKNNIEKKEYKKAIEILEKIEPKNFNILKTLIDLYIIENYPHIKITRKLNSLFLYKEFSSFEATLIIKKLKENKRDFLVFYMLKRCIRFFNTDPFFKIEMIKILIKNGKYNLSCNIIKRFKTYIGYENYNFYKGYILRENNKKIRSLFYFYRLVKNHSFNIVYRYFLSCTLEELHLYRISKKQINFIKDFLRFIPKIVNYDYDESNIKRVVFKALFDEFGY